MQHFPGAKEVSSSGELTVRITTVQDALRLARYIENRQVIQAVDRAPLNSGVELRKHPAVSRTTCNTPITAKPMIQRGMGRSTASQALPRR